MTLKTVFTDGVFDLLHANHVSFLQEAKTYGDRLIVGVVSDAQAQSFKRRPIINQTERLRVVQALGCVDDAFIIEVPLNGEAMEQIIAEYDVDAVVYSGDSTPEFYRPAEDRSIMHRPAYRTGINSSEIIGNIVERHQAGEF